LIDLGIVPQSSDQIGFYTFCSCSYAAGDVVFERSDLIYLADPFFLRRLILVATQISVQVQIEE
jgi:hypothetical protein